MKKIETSQAPKAIGPYSQAVAANGLLFISGQLPINPATGTISETSIEGQTEQVLANLAAILQADNLTFQDVVKVEIFVQDISSFPIINTLYGKKFSHPIQPARQLIQAAKLPLGSLIEISCIARRNQQE